MYYTLAVIVFVAAFFYFVGLGLLTSGRFRRSKIADAFFIGMFIFAFAVPLFALYILDIHKIPVQLYFTLTFAGGVVGVFARVALNRLSRPTNAAKRRPRIDEAEIRRNKDKYIADLKNEDPGIRDKAITNLAVLRDTDTALLLFAYIEDENADPGVSNDASEALTAILREPDRVPQLIACLEDEEPAARLRVTEVLAWVTGQDFGEDEEKWNAWWEQNKPTEKTEKKKRP